MKPDRALEVLLSRGFGVGYSAVMVLAFSVMALFGSEGSAQLVWTFGAGVHFGMGFMWLIAPRVTEKWRREMREELDKIAEEFLKKRRGEFPSFPSPSIVPFNPHERRMH